VILTKLPKQDLEAQLAEAAMNYLGTHVIVRSGFPHVQVRKETSLYS
jgi:hypothetical protein